MATRTTAQDGVWSATTTWTGGVVPNNGDVAHLTHTVTMDIVTNSIASITISAGGNITQANPSLGDLIPTPITINIGASTTLTGLITLSALDITAGTTTATNCIFQGDVQLDGTNVVLNMCGVIEQTLDFDDPTQVCTGTSGAWSYPAEGLSGTGILFADNFSGLTFAGGTLGGICQFAGGNGTPQPIFDQSGGVTAYTFGSTGGTITFADIDENFGGPLLTDLPGLVTLKGTFILTKGSSGATELEADTATDLGTYVINDSASSIKINGVQTFGPLNVPVTLAPYNNISIGLGMGLAV